MLAVAGKHEDRIKMLQASLRMSQDEMEAIRSNVAAGAAKKDFRLARIEGPVNSGDNTFAITFLDGSFPESIGNQMPSYSTRQAAPAGFAHNLRDATPGVGEIVGVHRWSERWWFERGAATVPPIILVDSGYWFVGEIDNAATGTGASFGFFRPPPYTQGARVSGFLRFGSVPTPNSATIISATISIASTIESNCKFLFANFGQPPGQPPGPPDGRYASRGSIFGDDVDNAAGYGPGTAWDAAPRTAASTGLDIGTVYEGAGSTLTPEQPPGSNVVFDVTAIVQEIVNRPGWSPGGNMQFFFDESGSDNVDFGSPSYSAWSGFDPFVLTITI